MKNKKNDLKLNQEMKDELQKAYDFGFSDGCKAGVKRAIKETEYLTHHYSLMDNDARILIKLRNNLGLLIYPNWPDKD